MALRASASAAASTDAPGGGCLSCVSFGVHGAEGPGSGAAGVEVDELERYLVGS